jgi:hypothetical protein
MLFTADDEEPRRALQKFIAAEINPFVDEWEKAELFPAHQLFKKLGADEIMLTVLCKMMGTLPGPNQK